MSKSYWVRNTLWGLTQMGEIKVEGREATCFKTTAITAIFNPELVFGQCGMRSKYRVGRTPYLLQAGLAPGKVIWECGLFLHSSAAPTGGWRGK